MKELRYPIGSYVKVVKDCDENDRIGEVVGVLATVGMDYPPDSDAQYLVKFFSNSHGHSEWHQLFMWREIEKSKDAPS